VEGEGMKRRMIRFEKHITLRGNVMDAWKVIANPAQWNQWTDQLALAENTEGDVGVGTRLQIYSSMVCARFAPIRKIPIGITIEECTPGESFIWSGRFLGIDGRHGFDLKTLDEEHYEVVQWEELFGWKTWLVQTMGVWAAMQLNFERLLNHLRNHLTETTLNTRGVNVEIDGMRMHYKEVGVGDPVLLLHGYPQNHLCWRHQAVALKDSMRLIVPDLIGWGQSEQSLEKGHTYEEEVQRLIQFVEKLDCGPVHLVAHDYGGYLAMGMTKNSPELFRSHVLLNSRAHGTFKKRWRYLFIPLLRWISQIPVLGRYAAWLPVKAVHRYILRRELRLGLFGNPGKDLYFEQWKRGGHANHWLFHFFGPDNGYCFSPREELTDVQAEKNRTLIVWGQEDTFLNISIAKELTRIYPNSELKILPDVGHYAMEEAPIEVTNAIQQFLSRE